MRILALADVESPALWDYFNPERLKDIDVILSCGDLDPRYLSFLATFFSGPVLYVHGNHDGFYDRIPRRDASASRIRSTSTTESASWAWGDPCATNRGPFSTPSWR